MPLSGGQGGQFGSSVSPIPTGGQIMPITILLTNTDYKACEINMYLHITSSTKYCLLLVLVNLVIDWLLRNLVMVWPLD